MALRGETLRQPGVEADEARSPIDATATEQEFRAFFELAAVGAAQIDAVSGRFLRANRRLCEMLGYTAGELQGVSFLELLHPSDRPSDVCRFRDLYRGRTPEFVFEKRLLRKEGVAIWASVTGTMVHDEHGHPVRAVAIIQDTTARRYAEDSLREQGLRLTALFERAAVGLSEISLYGKFRKGNDELCRIFGRGREELPGMGLGDVIHPADAQAAWRGLSDLVSNGQPVSLELRYRRPNGETVSTHTTFSLLSETKGQAESVLAVVADLTDRREAEAAQRQSENQYRTLAELVPDLLWRCDGPGVSCWYNRRWLDYTGQSITGAIQLGWGECVHPEDRPAVVAGFEYARKNGERFRQECRLRRGLDGAYRWFLLQMVPVRDEGGSISQWFGAATDIHEERAALDVLQTAEERIRLAVDAANMGFWDWDLERGIIQWEARHNRMLGLPEDQREGCYPQFLERVHPDDRTALESAVDQAVRSGETYAAEFRAVWPDGTIRWVAGRGRVFRDRHGHSARMIGAVLDITERKQVERELQEKQARLEEALGTAEAAGNAKDEFIATLSHELRTPLNPVLMVAAEAAADTELPEDVRSSFQIVRKNVELEARLIDDLLDLTRITRGKMSFDRRVVDIHAVLRDAIETILPDLLGKQIELSSAFNASVTEVDADPVRLQQIFWNILRNAVKFTPQHGQITIVSENPPDSGRVHIRIVDTGMGMTQAELDRIFDAFTQGEHALHRPGKHQFGGLGLGLAISQRLAEMQGGHIRAQSEGRGHGATFIVDFPTALCMTGGPSSVTYIDQPLRLEAPVSLRILLVEDHDSTRNALARLLERRHHHVASASLGEDAIKLIRAERFDVVISDLGLPDVDGCSLLLKLRETQPDLPGIALSGWGMDEDVRRSREAGFAEHLVKPISVHKLEAAAVRVLEGQARAQ
jgi:PAS domain S-box-containing protein